MRLLSHNTMRNNSKDAKGKGFPLRITATEIRVEENNMAVTEPQIEFVKSMLSRLDWPALVKVCRGQQVFGGLCLRMTVFLLMDFCECQNWNITSDFLRKD